MPGGTAQTATTSVSAGTAPGSPRRLIRVLDMINTDRSALELLDRRVMQVNATGRYQNDILCSSGECIEHLRELGHTIHVVETPRALSPVGILRAAWQTYGLLKRRRIDVVHIHGSVIWLVAVLAAGLARTPVVLAQVHGWHHHDNMRPLHKSLYVRFQRLLCARVDSLLYQNQADIDECRSSRLAPSRKNVPVGNGVQVDAFPLREPPDADPPTILCVARLEPVKNHFMLFEAARILRGRGRRFVINVVGDGHLRPTYQTWIAEHNLTEFVRLLGYRSDVPELTAGADICTLVSVKEGLPRAVIEAGVCGRPIVATDVIGTRESIIAGETGFLVPLNDPTALADRLEELIADRRLRHRMGRTARAHAEEHFDERKVTERIIEVYDQCVAQM